MPLYEYKCEGCGRVFEVIQKFADAPVTVDEVCGGAVHRLLSAPALQFKGSGWYVNDYAKGGSSSGSSSGGDGSKRSDGSGSESSASDGSGSKSAESSKGSDNSKTSNSGSSSSSPSESSKATPVTSSDTK